MDIILTPTKLNGTIHSRPSAVSVCFHEAATKIASLIDPSQSAAGTICEHRDMLSRSEIAPTDMDSISNCIDSLSQKVDRIDCGASLAALYMMLPMASARRDSIAFVGDSTLAGTDIASATEILKRHGVAFSMGGLKIKRRDRGKYEEIVTASGRLQYGHYSLNGNEDPWFLCGLLFTLPLLEGNSTIRTTTLPESTELADMAVSVLKQYGIHIDASVDEYGYPHYAIDGSQEYRIPESITLDGDWTAAAFWLGCGALGGNVTVRGLDPNSPQSSRQILDKLHTMGAAAGIGDVGANVTAASLTGCNINAGHIPNLLPILAVCLASASGTSALTDTGDFPTDLIVKILNKLGAAISEDGATLRFTGKPILDGGDSGHDSDPICILTATAASCVCGESVLIRNAGAINKYYPGFYDEFELLGGRIRTLP